MPSTKSKKTPQLSCWRFQAIGTEWSIETNVSLPSSIRDKITTLIETFDATFSRFRNDSVVSNVSRGILEVQIPPEWISLLDLYEVFGKATRGKVNPLVGDSLERIGYDAEYSLVQKGDVISAPGFHDTLQWSDDGQLTFTRPTMLDVGAIGKGFLVDRIGELLEREGIGEYVIDASGDIRHRGSRPFVIGLEHPEETGSVIRHVSIQNESLCASATNRRRWGNELHHIIDAKTGAPTNEYVATWAIAATTAEADGLATSLFFVDSSVLQTVVEHDYVRLSADGVLDYSLARHRQ